MRNLPKLLMAGAGMLACAGAATAAETHTKIMNVALPDGSVAQIRYKGDVSPRVIVVPRAASTLVADFYAPFAMFDRIAADMDRQMHAMIRQSELLARQARLPESQLQVAGNTLPPGTIRYSFVSTSNGANVCGRSVQVTSAGPNQAPKVVSKSFGNCADRPAGVERRNGKGAAAAQRQPDLRKTI